jgi:NADPH:quinone reductase-like Zn-dependent oxidoreductase
VIATAGSGEKAERLRALGADEVDAYRYYESARPFGKVVIAHS